MCTLFRDTMDSSSPLPPDVRLALAEAAGLPVKRKPGRPRKFQPAPTVDERQCASAENERRDAYVANDELVRCLDLKAGSSVEALRTIITELAIEAAVIGFSIQSAHSASRSDGLPQMLSRRIDALAKVASIAFEMHKLGFERFDPRCDAVQRVFALFIATLAGVASETLPNADLFMNRCGHGLAGWENRVGTF